MAEIIVLTQEAAQILRPLIMNEINTKIDARPGSKNADDLEMLHRIYADVVKKVV